MSETAVIAGYVRTPFHFAAKGDLASVRGDDLAAITLKALVERTDEILAAVDLMPKAQTRCGQLSGGQLRRVGLAQVLIGRPQVLLLDEPTAGLDPAQRIRLRTVLHRVPDDNVVVVASIENVDALGVHTGDSVTVAQR